MMQTCLSKKRIFDVVTSSSIIGRIILLVMPVKQNFVRGGDTERSSPAKMRGYGTHVLGATTQSSCQVGSYRHSTELARHVNKN
jgi:hypothetical protein